MQPYFSHDIFTRENLKIKKLINKHKMAGYGVFWGLVEFLHNNNNSINVDEIDVLAIDLGVEKEIVESVLFDFNLFSIKKNVISSKRIAQNIKIQKEKSQKAKESAMRRWQEVEPDANALRSQCEGNAIKEKKVEEKKEKKKNKKKEKKAEESKEKEIKHTNSEEKPENEQIVFYGKNSNVGLTPSRYSALASLYGRALTDTVIDELSYNIGVKKEQNFDSEYPDMHYLRLERYLLRKQSLNAKKGSPSESPPESKSGSTSLQTKDALPQESQAVDEEQGVPPPPEFYASMIALKKRMGRL